MTDRSLASGRVCIIKAVLAIDGDIHNLHARSLQFFSETVEISRVKGTEMAVVRLDIVNVEFFHYLAREILEVHSRHTRVTLVVGWTFNVGAKRVRRNGDAIPRCARQRYVWRGDS